MGCIQSATPTAPPRAEPPARDARTGNRRPRKGRGKGTNETPQNAGGGFTSVSEGAAHHSQHPNGHDGEPSPQAPDPRTASVDLKKVANNPNHAAHLQAGAHPAGGPSAAGPHDAAAISANQPAAPQPQHPEQPTQAPATARPQAPVTATVDTGKKVTLRQTIQMALQIARQQREKFGKFRRDEKHGVMELYDVMGLDDDTPIAPLSEFQQQLSEYRFPPSNMHMLRDVETVDEETVLAVLGPAEAARRKQDGTVKVRPVERREDAVQGAKRRAGVSGDTTKALKKPHTAFKSIPKTHRQTETLQNAMRSNILFRGLDSHDVKMLFDAFEQEEFPENTVIFDKGDEGDKFYLIESGRCQIVITDDDGTDKGSVFVGSSDTFGELGVMYGTPRAATVVAVLDTVTWWIDRDTYRGLLLLQTLRKRERYLQFLKKVEIFQSIDNYELTRIADVLELTELSAGTVIVREGETGDTFYMIEEGSVEVSSKAGGVLSRLQAGKVFGEVALLFDRPRMATVSASTDVRLCTLNRTNFANYLGPFEDILRRNADQYKRMMQTFAADRPHHSSAPHSPHAV